MVFAAVLSLAWARDWRRLGHLAAAGVLAAAIGLGAIIVLSDGVFADVLPFHVAHLAGRKAGMWTTIDSGFAEMKTLLGITTPAQWSLNCLENFYEWPRVWLSMGLLAASLLAAPIWLARCGRGRRDLQAFTVLWPASWLVLNFAGVDFVSAAYFIPFVAFSSFLLGALVWQATRYVAPVAAATGVVVLSVALGTHFATALAQHRTVWFYGRAGWITDQYKSVLSFTPMVFAATGTEPGCGFENPALTYQSFGDTFLTGRLTRFRVSDEQLIACLRAHPEMPIVIDWAFYFFTRPGSALREYLHGEGRERRLFFSPAALEQWDRPMLTMSP
jgi:hypothetical protein